MQEHCTELTEDLAKKCIIRLSLDKRENYLTPPVGLAGKDIFPWSYNRELSYLRRPVIRYQYDDGTVMCMFGFRSFFHLNNRLLLLHSYDVTNIKELQDVRI